MMIHVLNHHILQEVTAVTVKSILSKPGKQNTDFFIVLDIQK